MARERKIESAKVESAKVGNAKVEGAKAPSWTFLSNHSHVLLCLAKDPEARLRDVAEAVGITERAVQKIVSELEEAGYVRITKEGRRNTYEIVESLPLRHPVEWHRTVASIIALVRETELKRR